MFCNCFWTSFSSSFFNPLACALSKTVWLTFLKYLKTAMITLQRLLLECVLERHPRTMKEIFNSIYNARVSILWATGALQRFLFSKSLSISKTRHKDGWDKLCGLWKYYKTCLLKTCNSITLFGRNVQKLLCVLNAIRRNILQIINNMIHQKRKKVKKWWKHHDVEVVIYYRDSTNTKKSGRQSLDKSWTLNVKR